MNKYTYTISIIYGVIIGYLIYGFHIENGGKFHKAALYGVAFGTFAAFFMGMLACLVSMLKEEE